ncbi:hypothetical protein M501DRAFT_991084 [Patellaria atrata CBS 101060]|uniref:Uncharacterized protein n=1 Tax=Patellaria atrata CBS 101060 TaxID=1346257 RepID=A0A9P4VNR0_9PEZI|nr:hypothetical protein M501DRAFT_991084 [Patellaria atrata CBS 101060]
MRPDLLAELTEEERELILEVESQDDVEFFADQLRQIAREARRRQRIRRIVTGVTSPEPVTKCPFRQSESPLRSDDEDPIDWSEKVEPRDKLYRQKEPEFKKDIIKVQDEAHRSALPGIRAGTSTETYEPGNIEDIIRAMKKRINRPDEPHPEDPNVLLRRSYGIYYPPDMDPNFKPRGPYTDEELETADREFNKLKKRGMDPYRHPALAMAHDIKMVRDWERGMKEPKEPATRSTASAPQEGGMNQLREPATKSPPPTRRGRGRPRKHSLITDDHNPPSDLDDQSPEHEKTARQATKAPKATGNNKGRTRASKAALEQSEPAKELPQAPVMSEAAIQAAQDMGRFILPRAPQATPDIVASGNQGSLRRIRLRLRDPPMMFGAIVRSNQEHSRAMLPPSHRPGTMSNVLVLNPQLLSIFDSPNPPRNSNSSVAFNTGWNQFHKARARTARQSLDRIAQLRIRGRPTTFGALVQIQQEPQRTIMPCAQNPVMMSDTLMPVNQVALGENAPSGLALFPSVPFSSTADPLDAQFGTTSTDRGTAQYDNQVPPLRSIPRDPLVPITSAYLLRSRMGSPGIQHGYGASTGIQVTPFGAAYVTNTQTEPSCNSFRQRARAPIGRVYTGPGTPQNPMSIESDSDSG